MLEIAICDDDAIILKTLGKYFGKLNDATIKYDIYNSADTLYRYVEEQGTVYDVFILDIEMQGMNGLELAQKIREKDSNCLIIFLIIIKNYWKGNLIDLPLKINVFLCLIHILGIISCCIVVRVIWLYDIPEEWLLCTSIIFIVLFINILIFSVFKKMNIYKSILAENSDNISYNLSKILKRKVRKIFSQTVHSNNTKTNLYSRYISLGVIKCTTIFKLYLQI